MKKRYIISWIISIAIIAYILSSIDLGKVVEEVSKVNVLYLVLFTAVYSSSFVFRSIRWKAIVDPIKKTNLKTMFFLTNVGYFVNDVLPARLGEIARAYLLSKKAEIGKIKSFSTVVLDRVLDGVTLIVLSLLAIIAAIGIQESFYFHLALAIVIFFGGFLFFIFPKEFAKAFRPLWKIFPEDKKAGEGKAASIKDKIKKFYYKVQLKKVIRKIYYEISEGRKVLFSGIKNNAILWSSSFIIWIIEAAYFLSIAWVFGVQLSIFQAIILVAFVGISTMIPSAPGFIGTFEAAFLVALGLFGVNASTATAIALVTHALQFAIVMILGAISLHGLDISFKKLSRMGENEERN